jgi:hypothetical protein
MQTASPQAPALAPTCPGRIAMSQHLAQAQSQLAVLQSLDPYLLDVSLREPCVSSPIGHILANKQALLALTDGFGLGDKVIATFDYQLPEVPEVEDDFCAYLNSVGYDLGHCFAFTQIGQIVQGVFQPDLSMQKLVTYKLPNTVNEVYLMSGLSWQTPIDELITTVQQSVDWLRQNLVPGSTGSSRIYINIVDLLDAYYAFPEWTCQFLEALAQMAVDAVSFEDGRGTFFPFQVGAVVASLKQLLAPTQKVLFHIHAGNGMENAVVLEALMQGADGYWAGLEKESSTIGHASLGELMANLVRAGNTVIPQRYPVDQLASVVTQMHQINTASELPQDWPVQGSHAYCEMLSSFAQVPGRFMDLPPQTLGQPYGHRIAPVVSDPPVIQARVLEALGQTIDVSTAQSMIILMRDDLRAGHRIPYDDPDQLTLLLKRAQAPQAVPKSLAQAAAHNAG